jgi:hypothetical protein
MMNSLNYRSLQEPLSYAEAKKTISTQDDKYKVVIAVLAIFMVILLVGSANYSSNSASFTVSAATAIFFLAAMSGVYLYHRTQTIRTAKLVRFASDNGMKSLHNHTLAENERNGLLFKDGWERKILASVDVQLDNVTAEIGNYRYITGRGRGARTRNFTYIRIPLSQTMPNLYIDSLKNQKIVLFPRNHKNVIDQSQKIVLSDLKKFAVYVPTHWREKMTQILNQGGAHDLDRLNTEYDIELAGDSLVASMYHNKNLSDQKTFEGIVHDAEALQQFFDRWLAGIAITGREPNDDDALKMRRWYPVLAYIAIVILVSLILYVSYR